MNESSKSSRIVTSDRRKGEKSQLSNCSNELTKSLLEDDKRLEENLIF